MIIIKTSRAFFKTLLALSMLLPAATITAMAQNSEAVTVRDIFNLEKAEHPQISPNGKYVVYERHYNDIKTDSQYSNIWIATVDGLSNHPISTGLYKDYSPRWSPDGEQMVFVSNRKGVDQLFRYNMKSQQISAITHLEFSPQNFRWSPDGKSISFVSLVPGEPLVIGEMPSPPPGATWAAPPRAYDTLRYRWDGVGYLPRGKLQVFVLSLQDGKVRQVSDNIYPNGGTMIADSPQPLAGPAQPEWSPDGKYLYVSTVRRKDYEYHAYNTEIYKLTVANGTMTQLTDRVGPDSSPVVSPDGKHIAYLGYDDHEKGYQVVNIYLIGRDGGKPIALSQSLDRDARSLSWSRDSKFIYFIYDDRGETELAKVSLKGKIENLAQNLGSNPAAYPSGNYSVAANGAIAYTLISTNHFGKIAIRKDGDLADSSIIVDVNKAIFANKKTGLVKEISYKSSRDGLEIHGWVIYPPDFDPAKKYPLILEIHGGPYTDYGPRFDLHLQSMAARGFIVLYTNPRGSTSYGEKFGNYIQHAYPGDDYYDLMDGVNTVASHNYIDKGNVFITGGSGGGILSAWAIGMTNRFRAASIQYPAVNFYSWVLTSDKAFKLVKYFFPAAPWKAAENYNARSPISLVGNVHTPALIMTGDEDYRTPSEEAEQFYTALKLQGVEAVLVKYPGESHGIGRRPSHKISTTENTIGWFEKHLSK